MIVRTGLNLVALFARISAPFVPFTADIIAQAVGEPSPNGAAGAWPEANGEQALSILPPGRAVKAPEVLFRKIEDAQVAEWTERFGGAPAPA